MWGTALPHITAPLTLTNLITQKHSQKKFGGRGLNLILGVFH